jgi:SAM-dependent methyltransferase
MSEEAPQYVHGTAPREQERLGIMNDILNQGALRAIAPRPGERILDLGCGLAQLTRALARASAPADPAIGVERSTDQLREAERLASAAGEAGLVDLRQGDALAPPLQDDEWGRFDLAHTRFLLEHLPRPLDAVRVMVRAVRPGGRVVLQDEDHDILRLWPEPPGFYPLWRAYIRTYERNGNDPYVGRRLAALLEEAGAPPSRSDWIYFGGCSGEPHFTPLVENMVRILEGARGAIVGPGGLKQEAYAAAIDALRPWAALPGTGLWYALACVQGIRR